MSKYKCINCKYTTNNFNNVWNHVKDALHLMKVHKPRKCIISELCSITHYTNDEYLFMANCSDEEFYNFFVWRK